MVLGLLVVCVLIFTSFFREGEGGFLHHFKSTVDSAFAPVQDAAVAAVRPIRDGWSWFADLRNARSERDRLRTEVARLNDQLTAQNAAAQQNAELRQQLKLASEGPAGYRAVAASVLARPADLSQRVQLDKGRSDGVVLNALVLAPDASGANFGALAGIVTSTTSTTATVTFITDPSIQVGARLLNSTSPLGLLHATASGQLILDHIPSSVAIVDNDTVVTSGTGTIPLPSPYPPGLRIGTVTSFGTPRQEPGEFQTVQVTPFVDPTQLSTFTVFVPASPEARRRAGA